MAAHSPTTTIIPSVMAYQPPGGWDAWLREIAQAINLAAARLETIEARIAALEAALAPP